MSDFFNELDDDFDLDEPDYETDLISEYIEKCPPSHSSFYISNQLHEKLFLDFISLGNLPHALLFSGPRGIGKATFAFRLSRYLLKYGAQQDTGDSLFGDSTPAFYPPKMDMDEDDPVFRRIASGGHPDFMYLKPEEDKKGLDVEQIRKITPFLRKTAAQDEGWRVVLVDEADSMNRNAQNALLKILEEPPKNVLILLIAHNSAHFLPTLISRVRRIEFTPPSFQNFEAIMNRYEPNMDRILLNFLYEISNASPGKSFTFIDHNAKNIFDTLISNLSQAPHFGFEKLHDFSEQFGKSDTLEGWESFKDIFMFILRTLAINKARAILMTEAFKPLQVFVSNTKLEDLLNICDILVHHFRQADIGNLDKRQAVLESFVLIEQYYRKN
jgi:DNA polymerase-3 subunit delta'